MKRLDVVLLYNEPALADDDPDRASEAGVLDSVEAVSTALKSRGHHVSRLAGRRIARAMLSRRYPQIDQGDVVFNLFEGFGRRRPWRGRNRGAARAHRLAAHRLAGRVPGAGARQGPHQVAAGRSGLADARLRRDRGRWSAESRCTRSAAGQRRGDRQAGRTRTPAWASGGKASSPIVRRLCGRSKRCASRYGAVLVEQFVVGREFNAAIVALPEPRAVAAGGNRVLRRWRRRAGRS